MLHTKDICITENSYSHPTAGFLLVADTEAEVNEQLCFISCTIVGVHQRLDMLTPTVCLAQESNTFRSSVEPLRLRVFLGVIGCGSRRLDSQQL